MSRARTSNGQQQPWQLAGMAVQLCLVGAVVFWWGGYVVSHLFSLTFPELLPPWNTTLGRLNASNEGTIANAFSAATLAGVSLLAVGAAVASARRATGWLGIGGWVVMALTTAALTFEELAEFKKVGPVSVVGHAERLGIPWPVLVSPLVVAYVVVIGIFIRRGLSSTSVRAPLLLGIICWVFALFHEAIDPLLFAGRARPIEFVLEETLEYSGTLLVGASATLALRGCDQLGGGLFGDHWRRMLMGAAAAVTILVALAVVFVFRPPLIEALAPYTRAGAFAVSLQRHEALVQEFRMPAVPVQSLRLLLSNCNTGGRAAPVAVRVTTVDAPDRVLSQGSVEIPAGDCPRWRDVALLPPLTATEGLPLALQVASEIDPGAEIGVGATKGNQYPDGRLWINGELAWADQNLEFVAYGPREPTSGKLLGIRHLVTSDWRWLLLVADLAVALTLIALVPSLLVASAYEWTSKTGRSLFSS